MRNKQYPVVPEIFVRAVDRALEAESQVTGQSTPEILDSDAVLEVARFAVSEIIPGPFNTAQARYVTRRISQELGNRQG